MLESRFVEPFAIFTEEDTYLFKEGKHTHLFERMGGRLVVKDGIKGACFTVFAPAASKVEVLGDFNAWNSDGYSLFVRWDSSGIWEGFIPNAKKGDKYKFKLLSNIDGKWREKFDPYALHNESPPSTASVLWNIDYKWQDQDWMLTRAQHNDIDKPYSIYEVHLGSWKRKSEDENRSLSYKEHIQELVPYVKEMGFTHVELMPVMEHPYEPSWGYQVTGFFTPTSRYGSPEEFLELVDAFHAAGIGVILDWVPAHFPKDEFALAAFDGSSLLEHPDPKKGYHNDWDTYIFNFERNETRSFLLSSAVYWSKMCHADGLRVDAVASMIYLDYSREEGEWEPNEFGGNENLAAISFIKDFNLAVYSENRGFHTMAEESTSFTGVTRPTYNGGLGFGMKWMMGWMNDTLVYFQKDPIYRKHHQNNITFSFVYAFTENFLLPLSHDEVVHGKKSMLSKMPGDEWNRFANLRTLYSFMFAHPGSKLLFMGNEIGQYEEWNQAGSLDWHLLQYEPHKGIQNLIKDLNGLYTSERALSEWQYNSQGFEWIDYSDHKNTVIAFLRKCSDNDETLLIVCNFSPIAHDKYALGVPNRGVWKVIFNSDETKYWGSNFVNQYSYDSQKNKQHGRMFSIDIQIPPMAVIVLKAEQ